MKLDIDKINREIERRGWSIKDFAEALQSARTFPYYLLNPKIESHTFKTVVRVAEVLEFDPKDLIK